MFQVRSEAVGVRQQKDADAVGRALKCSDERLAAHAHVCFAVHAEAGLCAAGICVQPRRVAGRGSQLDALLGSGQIADNLVCACNHDNMRRAVGQRRNAVAAPSTL